MRTPRTIAEQRKEQRSINNSRRLKEYRARVRKGLAVYPVEVDAAVLDMLVERNYITADQLTDKKLVAKALSQILWDPAHAKKY